MDSKIVGFFIIIGMLYIWINKEHFNNYQKYCNKYIPSASINEIRQFKHNGLDKFGFKLSRKKKAQYTKKLHSKLTVCPIQISHINAYKLINTKQFKYIIDIRPKHVHMNNPLAFAIWVEYLDHYPKKASLLDHLCKQDFVLIIGLDSNSSFRAGKILKMNGFRHVYYIS